MSRDEDAYRETVAALGETRDDTSAGAAGAADATGEPKLPEVARDRYALGPEVGRGGIGRVRRARDTVLERTIAIKELQVVDAVTRQRFVREAMITARLQHPSIVPIYEAGWRDGAPFYTMKLVGGRTLTDAIARAETLEARLALLPSIQAVADAMAYAHGEQIIHRDLKPGNVLVGEFGETIVIDWGLAKDLAAATNDAQSEAEAEAYRARWKSDQTVDGAVLGTPAYMAPEQAEGGAVDARADVYAIGAMLYHLITRTVPREGKSHEEVLDEVARGRIVPLVRREPNTPPELVTIVEKAMAHDASARYPTARELADDLRRFQTGQLVAAHRYTFGQHVRRWVRRHRGVVAIAAVALVVLICAGAWGIDRINTERDDAVAKSVQVIDEKNRSTLAEATRLVERDPVGALQTLAKLERGGQGWAEARLIARSAMARPRPDRILEGPYQTYAWRVDDRGVVVMTSPTRIWIADLETAASLLINFTSDVPAAMCRDGQHVVAYHAHGDGTATLATIDRMTGVRRDEVLSFHDARARSAKCGANGGFAIAKTTLETWDDALGDLKTVLTDDGLMRVRMTEDGASAMVLGSFTRRLERWSAGVLRGRIDRTGAPVRDVRWSRDGRYVVFRQPLEEHDLDTGRFRQINLDPPDAMAVAATGAVAVANGVEVTISTADEHRRKIKVAHPPTQLELSADGRTLLVASSDDLELWELDTAELRSLGAHEGIRLMRFVDLGSRRYVVTIDSHGKVRRWAVDERLGTPVELEIQASARTFDGRTVVTATRDAITRTRDGVSETRTIQRAMSPMGIAVHPDGEVTLVSDHLFRWPLGGKLEQLDPGMQRFSTWVPSVAYAKHVPIVHEHDRLEIWDPAQFRQVEDLELVQLDESPQVESRLTVSPDGTYAALGLTSPYKVEAWLVDVEHATKLSLPGASGRHVEFSPDGRTLATAAAGGGLILWDVATRTPRRIAEGDLFGTFTAYAPDGGAVAVAGSGEVLVARVDGTRVQHLAVPNNTEATGLHWSPNGKELVITMQDRVMVYDIAVDRAFTLPFVAERLTVQHDHLVIDTDARSIPLVDPIPESYAVFAAWLDAQAHRYDPPARSP